MMMMIFTENYSNLFHVDFLYFHFMFKVYFECACVCARLLVEMEVNKIFDCHYAVLYQI